MVSLNIYKEIGYRKGIVSSYNNMGLIYESQGNYPEALKKHFASLKIKEEIKDKRGIAISYNNIGNIYWYQGNYPAALNNFLAALKLIEETGDKERIASSYNNIGNVYSSQNNYSEALNNYFVSLKIREEIKDKQGIGTSYNNIGAVYMKQHLYPEALKNYLASLKIKEEIKDKDGIAGSFINLGILNTKLNRLKEAEAYLNKALNIAKEIKDRGEIKEIYNSLMKLDSMQGNWKAAYLHHKLFTVYKDSIDNDETKKKIIQSAMTYEFDKKEAIYKIDLANKEVELNRKKYLIYGLISLSAVILVIGLLVVRQNKLRSTRSMQLEQKLLRSQMNPHFIFNSLSAIESFIYKNEPREAGRYLSGFARLIRMILENSREEYISLQKEIKSLEYYLELQKLRFEEDFNYTIEVAEGIDTENFAIPPMLAQPFIENSIEHGIKNITTRGEINIRFSIQDNKLFFELKDNGIGIEKTMAIKKENKEHQSLATIITTERLSILNKGKAKKVLLQIGDLKDSFNNILGTQVSFIVPFKEI